MTYCYRGATSRTPAHRLRHSVAYLCSNGVDGTGKLTTNNVDLITGDFSVRYRRRDGQTERQTDRQTDRRISVVVTLAKSTVMVIKAQSKQLEFRLN